MGGENNFENKHNRGESHLGHFTGCIILDNSFSWDSISSSKISENNKGIYFKVLLWWLNEIMSEKCLVQ